MSDDLKVKILELLKESGTKPLSTVVIAHILDSKKTQITPIIKKI